jgi:membrane protein
MVAVALALLQFFGADRLQLYVQRFIKDILAPGNQADALQLVDHLVNAAAARTAGGLSFVVVLVSAGLLLRQLDASLNEVWAVRRKRPLAISMALYAGALLIGPVFIGLSLAGTEGVKQVWVRIGLPFGAQALAVGATFVIVAALTLLYKLAPHAPVRLRSAFAGGLLAGVAWELVRVSYGWVTAVLFGANPIYGSLGIAPLFLLWVDISWMLVLFGARLAYAVENVEVRTEFKDLVSHPRSRELIAGRVAQLAARALLTGAPAPTVKTLTRKLAVPQQMLREVVAQLETAGLIVVGRKGELVPARHPSSLTVADLSAAVGGVAMRPGKDSQDKRSLEYQEFERMFADVDQANVEKLSRISWAELAGPDEPS